MASIRRDITIDAHPADVWGLVGDPARLAEWWPVESCRMEGDKRFVHLATGLVFEEDILLVDDVQRRFQYSIVNNPLIRDHLATVDVVDDRRGGSLVVYGTTCSPDVLALVTAGASGAALEKARTILEGRQ